MSVEFPEHYVELERVYSRTFGQGVRSLAVTSADEREGVTTLVVALAKRNRFSGRSTLVVDLNLHRPALQQRFGLTHVPPPPDGLHGPDALPRVTLGEGLTAVQANRARHGAQRPAQPIPSGGAAPPDQALRPYSAGLRPAHSWPHPCLEALESRNLIPSHFGHFSMLTKERKA
jgi:hypothetical protein